MAKKKDPVVKRSLNSWIFDGTVKLQILLLVLIVITVFTRVLPLEMQKRIVNTAIKLRDLDALLLYCGLYLAAVTADGLLKYATIIIETLISQKATAAMRKALFEHIITLPMGFFRNTQPGTAVNALVTELAVPGNFVGMSLSAPVINILTLLAFAAYLMTLNLTLALVSLSIYPVAIFLVPLLQKKVNRANKKRVDISRQLAGTIAEAISGIHEIQSNSSYRLENAKFSRLVDRLEKIRIIWTLFKQGVKSLNNYFTNLGPFLVFILGGYLAINGRLELGALVAFLSAQEKLYLPWKELIQFYQVFQDGTVTYKRTMEFFDVEPAHQIEPEDKRDPYKLAPHIKIEDMSFITDNGINLLQNINLELKPGEHLALVGFSGSGKSTLAQCIGQLYAYTLGHVKLDGHEVSELTKKDMAYNMGFVSQSPFIFSGTIEENLLYSCNALLTDGATTVEMQRPSLDDIIEVLQQTGLFVDVLRFGLNTVLPRHSHEELVEKLVHVRRNFQRDFGTALADYVEFFNVEKYMRHSSVAENLIFGTANTEAFAKDRLSEDPYFIQFLKDVDLRRPLLNLGAQLSRQTVDILGDLKPDAVFFEQSPIRIDELDDFKAIVSNLKKKKLHQLTPREQTRLLEIALRFTPARHKMVRLQEMLENLILEARAYFYEKITEEDPLAISFYNMSEYMYSQSILNNIFFGKTTTENPRAQERINQSIIQLLIEEDILEAIVDIGLKYDVGNKGDNLSGGQRQKLAIARIFLKNPPLVIMDEATSALDNNSQARIQNLLNTRFKNSHTVVAVVHRLDIIKEYDKVAVLKAGKIGEIGSYDDLMARKGMLYELVHGRK